MSGSSVLPSSVKLPIGKEILEDLIVKTKDYAIMNGGTNWSCGSISVAKPKFFLLFIAAMRSKKNFDPDGLQVNGDFLIIGQEFLPSIKLIDLEMFTLKITIWRWKF